MSAPAWAQVPSPPSRRASVAPWVQAAVIAAAGPAVRTAALDAPALTAAAAVAVSGAAAALVLQQIRRTPWWQRGLVALAAGALAAAASADPAIGVWVAAGSVLSLWATRTTPPIPGVPPAGPGAGAPVAVLSAVAAFAAREGSATVALAIPLGLSFAVPLLSRLGDGAVARLGHRFGTAVGHGVSTVCFTVLGLFAVLLPWCFQRVLRIDPLEPQPGWVGRRRRPLRPESPWTRDSSIEGRPRSTTVKTAALTMAVLVILTVGTPVGRRAVTAPWSTPDDGRRPFVLDLGVEDADVEEQPEPDVVLREPVPDGIEAYRPDGGPYAAHEGDDWIDSPDFMEGLSILWDPERGWSPVSVYRIRDLSSRWINVRDGVRASWTAPTCDCRRVKVWMYGGSAMFGLDQRDPYTIASYLARTAADDGLTVDVENRGSMGSLHWMEAERFSWDLTREEPPDLVIFYDGFNDQWAGVGMNQRGAGDRKPLLDPTTIDVWNSTGRPDATPPDPPQGAKRVEGPEVVYPHQTMGKMMARRYDQSRELSRRTAEVHGVPVRYVWQPERISRPVVLSEPHDHTDSENRNRQVHQVLIDALPDDLINLEDVFDGMTEPIFVDDVHHNERGAQIIAEALYDRIEDDLQALSEGKEVR